MLLQNPLDPLQAVHRKRCMRWIHFWPDCTVMGGVWTQMQHTVQLRQVKFFNRAHSPTQRQAEKLARQSTYTNTVKQRVQTQRLGSESRTEGKVVTRGATSRTVQNRPSR
ncbi:hypothetical protein LDENG_00257200 [Lucifuga dentata]|nr:hypothetical protein LDENG_00257200 [Lucifuga dentata]